jgi:hypothetical protein
MLRVVAYNNDGNIEYKSDAGNYLYGGEKPHAVTEIMDNEGNSAISFYY